MHTRLPVILATLTATLAWNAPTAAQCNPSNTLCPRSSISGEVDFVTAASFDGAAPGGTLTVTGIPAGATILNARFYCESSNGTFVTGASFDGSPVILNQVGLGLGTTAATHARSYSADVTARVTGDGSYTYTVAGGVNSGAGLVVLYEDCTVDGTYQIELHDGYNPGVFVDVSDGVWPNSTTFAGFSVDGTAAPHGEVSFLVMNAAPGASEEYSFQGVSLDCCDPATGGFEFERYDVSTFLSGGEVSATLDVSELGGVISIPVALFRVRTSPPTGPDVPVNYCTAGTSAAGCQVTLTATGTPSATLTSGFTLSATNVPGQRTGNLVFSSHGRAAVPWGTGTSFQCLIAPLTGTGLQAATGTLGQCDGAISRDLNALWCPTCPRPQKNPGLGARVQAQLWYRDPLSTSGTTTSLSDAIEFCIQP